MFFSRIRCLRHSLVRFVGDFILLIKKLLRFNDFILNRSVNSSANIKYSDNKLNVILYLKNFSAKIKMSECVFRRYVCVGRIRNLAFPLKPSVGWSVSFDDK